MRLKMMVPQTMFCLFDLIIKYNVQTVTLQEATAILFAIIFTCESLL